MPLTCAERLNKQKYYSILTVTASFFFILGWLAPFSLDDWFWGSSTGMELLNNYFMGYNGRFGGNLAILALSRSTFLRALALAAGVVAILVLVLKITRCKDASGALFLLLLLLLLPAETFMTTLTWASGFANYVVPVPMVLALQSVVNSELAGGPTCAVNSQSHSKKAITGYCLMAFCAQLFIETLTLYLALYLLCAGIAYKVSTKKYSTFISCLTLAALCGAVVMFANPSYLVAASTGAGHHKILFSMDIVQLVVQILTTIILKIIPYLVIDNVAMVFFFSIAICLIVKKSSKKLFRFSTFFLVLFNCYLIIRRTAYTVSSSDYYAAVKETLSLTASKFTSVFEFAMAMIFIVLLVLAFLRMQKYRKECLFFLASACVLTGPLVLVSPVASRVFFPQHVFLAISLVFMYKYIRSHLRVKWLDSAARLLPLCILGVMGLYGYVFYSLHISDAQRIALLHEQSTQEDSPFLVLEPLRFAGFVISQAPENKAFAQSFKEFYRLDTKKELVFSDSSGLFYPERSPRQ